MPPAADSHSEAGHRCSVCRYGGVHRHRAAVWSVAPAARSLGALCLRSLLSRSCDRLNSCSFRWERSSLLDRRSDGALILPSVRWSSESRAVKHRCWLLRFTSKEKTNSGPRMLLLLECFTSRSVDEHRKVERREFDLNRFLLLFVYSVRHN